MRVTATGGKIYTSKEQHVHDNRLCQTAPSFPDSVVTVALCSASALLLSLCAVSALVFSLVSLDLHLYLILYVENVYPEKDLMQYCNLSHQYSVCHIPSSRLETFSWIFELSHSFFFDKKILSLLPRPPPSALALESQSRFVCFELFVAPLL